jgi:pantetheine-phosphate adenylyltransferase
MKRNPKIDPNAPAARMAAKFNKNARPTALGLAKALGLAASTVQRWLEKGAIDSDYHQKIVEAARRLGIAIEPTEFVDIRVFAEPDAMTTRIGVYPGTFDPVTLGHMDIIRRGAKLCDRLVIGVTTNPSKSPMFSVEERMAMVKRETADIAGIDVVSFDSLLMDFAERQGASMIVRGLRAVADFEYEYQMAGMNQQLNDRIETVFLMADVSLQPIASRLVKEIALYGGDIHRFVPPAVVAEVAARVSKIGRKGDA